MHPYLRVFILRYPNGNPFPRQLRRDVPEECGSASILLLPIQLRRVEVLVGQVVEMELHATKFGRVGVRNERICFQDDRFMHPTPLAGPSRANECMGYGIGQGPTLPRNPSPNT